MIATRMPSAGALFRASRADDARSDHHYVIGERRHCCSSSPNAHAEWIARVEDQVRVRVDERRALDARVDLPVAYLNTAFKHAADDAFLSPHLAFAQLAVGIQAGQLGAGAGAAWRSVVRLAGAQDEIPAVDSGLLRRTEQLDVVDLLAIRACDAGERAAPGGSPR